MGHASPTCAAVLHLAAICGIAIAPGPARAAERRVVVALRPPPPGPHRGVTGDPAAGRGIAERFTRLGLGRVAPLDGPPLVRPGGRWTALDPARILIATAADSGAAARALAAMAGDPGVEWAELEQFRAQALVEARGRAGPLPPGPVATPGARAFPNDPLFARQWGLANDGAAGGVAGADVRARAAWARTTGSDSVPLAIADTGIDSGHPELAATLRDGGPRIVHAVDVTVDALPVMADSFGHGTLVAGVMAAFTNEGAHFDSLGIAGVCGGDGATTAGCRLVPIRITRGHSGYASSIDIARGLLHAAAVGARAVNLSFAGLAPSRLERLALAEALARGTVVVAAAGNRGFDRGAAPQYPAAHAADGLCIQVGASTPSDERAGFSSHGPGLDVLAPGLDIWTTFMTYPSAAGADWGGYALASGTSLAAPFATGALGLLCAARPELAAGDFQHVLRASAHDLGAAGPDSLTGWGRLDAARALELVGADRALAHAVLEAQAWRCVERDTLVLGESGHPLLDRLGRRAFAERWEVAAQVAVPDSLGDAPLGWWRATGTGSLRGDFRLPYLTPRAAFEATGPRSFAARGSVYRLADARLADTTVVPAALLADPAARWLPVPPARAAFAVTMLAPRRTPRASPPLARAIVLAPNPSRGPVRLRGRPGERVDVYDAGGRRIATLALSCPAGETTWHPRDASGRVLPAGIYRVRARGRAEARLVWMR